MIRSIEVALAAPPDPVGSGGSLSALLASEPDCKFHRSDLLHLALATKRVLEAVSWGQTAYWCNPDTGNYGKIVPFTEDITADGECHRFVLQTITAGRRTHQAYATARRQPDGTWTFMR